MHGRSYQFCTIIFIFIAIECDFLSHILMSMLQILPGLACSPGACALAYTATYDNYYNRDLWLTLWVHAFVLVTSSILIIKSMPENIDCCNSSVACLSLLSAWCCQWDNHQKEKKTCFSCEPDAVWWFAVTEESHSFSASDLKRCSQSFKNDLFFLMLLVECWTACWWCSEPQSAPYL